MVFVNRRFLRYILELFWSLSDFLSRNLVNSSNKVFIKTPRFHQQNFFSVIFQQILPIHLIFVKNSSFSPIAAFVACLEDILRSFIFFVKKFKHFVYADGGFSACQTDVLRSFHFFLLKNLRISSLGP